MMMKHKHKIMLCLLLGGFLSSPLVYAQRCETTNHHRFSGSLELMMQNCTEAPYGKLVWRNQGKTWVQDDLNFSDAVDVDVKQYGDTIALDFYAERGGTLLLANWHAATPKFYQLNYTGHEESGLCLQAQEQKMTVQRCAFKRRFGRVLTLQAAGNGWRVLNPEVLPDFTEWNRLPPIP